MSKQRGPWHDGHRAWQRLVAWLDATARAGRSTEPPAAAGEAALAAMADIGTIRRLLDQAELAAVRTARQQGRSWAEIATQLGITRQSAWERWRDLDEADDTQRELIGVMEREAVASRRTRKVVVPNVVGMTWDDARQVLINKRLVATHHDPDGASLAALGWPNTVVVDQIPESGAKVPVGTGVRLWLERGGGSAGDREPRRPLPDPKGGYEWRDEPTDEAAVG